VRQAAWKNTTPAVIVNIQRQPGANIIAVADRVKSVPAAVDRDLDRLRSRWASSPIAPTRFALPCATCSSSSCDGGAGGHGHFPLPAQPAGHLVPSVAVPLSLVGTLGVMYLLGYSLNNLTLMALTISTGFVVDDAIVMIENITRFIENGETPLQAALKGAEQIGFTIVSLTISLIAVLIPLLFMGDIVGRLFREFAVTLSVTILVSAVVSLTLTPMMSARVLKHTHQTGRFYRASERAFEAVIAFYGRTLQVILRHQTATLLVAAGTLVLTTYQFMEIPKGFFPIQDTGIIQGVSEAPKAISFPAMSERQQRLAAIILKDPEVESISSFIGIDGTNLTLNSGRIRSTGSRWRSARSTPAMDSPPPTGTGESRWHQPVHATRTGSIRRRPSQPHALQLTRRSEYDELNAFAPRMVEGMRQLPQLRDVASDQQVDGLRARPSTIAALHPAWRHRGTIDNTLYDAYGQRQVSTIFTQLNQYHVVLEVKGGFQQDPSA
jgi:multidrug efflux pump